MKKTFVILMIVLASLVFTAAAMAGRICYPPVFDQCPNIEGNQEEGTDCNPAPPTPPPPPCVPQNPDGSLGGKDGKPGNDDCAADPVTETPTPPVTPPVEPPVVEPPVVTPPVVTPPVVVVPPAEEEETTPTETTPTEPKPLEEDLDEQAESNGANNAPAPTPQAQGELPNTGLPLGLIALLGTGLTGLGVRLRRKP